VQRLCIPPADMQALRFDEGDAVPPRLHPRALAHRREGAQAAGPRRSHWRTIGLVETTGVGPVTCELCQDRGFKVFDRDGSARPWPCLRCGKARDIAAEDARRQLDDKAYGDAVLLLLRATDTVTGTPLEPAEEFRVVDGLSRRGKKLPAVILDHVAGRCDCWGKSAQQRP
jgi:hypothetical protein